MPKVRFPTLGLIFLIAVNVSLIAISSSFLSAICATYLAFVLPGDCGMDLGLRALEMTREQGGTAPLIVLRAPSAMSGTDAAYRATDRLRDVRYPLTALRCAPRCPSPPFTLLPLHSALLALRSSFTPKSNTSSPIAGAQCPEMEVSSALCTRVADLGSFREIGNQKPKLSTTRDYALSAFSRVLTQALSLRFR